MNDKVIAVVGATGLVGKEAIELIEDYKSEPKKLRLFASEKSAGNKIMFKDRMIEVEELTPESFEGIDIAIFSIGASLSKKFTPYAVKSGCIVVDNSSAFRMDKDVPLVVPEINPEAITKHKGIIANPNCTTIIMLMALYPLYKLSKIESVHFSSYQAVSGGGLKAQDELLSQMYNYVNGHNPTPSVFKHQILFNVFSHDSEILENGYNREEQKAVDETGKILSDNDIKISPTCVRVPVMRAHSIAISAVTKDYVSIDALRENINKMEGVKLVDDRGNNHFPMPIYAYRNHDVLIGRLRRGQTHKNEVMMFVSGDQLLKGAALNAFQIVEKLL